MDINELQEENRRRMLNGLPPLRQGPSITSTEPKPMVPKPVTNKKTLSPEERRIMLNGGVPAPPTDQPPASATFVPENISNDRIKNRSMHRLLLLNLLCKSLHRSVR